MGHYAKINDENKVVKVIVAEADFFDTFIDDSPGEWIKTSYNTLKGVHYQPNSNPLVPSEDQSKSLRKNYASVGYSYDRTRDAFIPPKPHASWTLDETTCWWEPPIPKPVGNPVAKWNEEAYQAALTDSSDTSVAWEPVEGWVAP